MLIRAVQLTKFIATTCISEGVRTPKRFWGRDSASDPAEEACRVPTTPVRCALPLILGPFGPQSVTAVSNIYARGFMCYRHYIAVVIGWVEVAGNGECQGWNWHQAICPSDWLTNLESLGLTRGAKNRTPLPTLPLTTKTLATNFSYNTYTHTHTHTHLYSP